MSHTQYCCNNGSASIEVAEDALKCCVSVCSAVWAELSSRQIRCGYLDLDLHMCFALILLPLTRVERREREVGGTEKRSAGKQWIMMQKLQQWHPWSFTHFHSCYNPSPTISTITTSSITVWAGNVIESCVGAWTVDQAMRCKTLLGLRQQLCTGPLLQIILAVKPRQHGLMWSPVFCLFLCQAVCSLELKS